MRISLSGSRPIVYRSLFMLYSAITEPSRLKTNLAMCFSLYRVSAEPTKNSVEHLSASWERIDDVRHGHLLELVAALAVQPRVTDVRDGDLVVEEQRRDHRGPHAFALGLRARGLIDDLVGAADRIAQDDVGSGQSRLAIGHCQVLTLDVLAHQVDDRLDGDAARDFAGVVAAHAVGQHHQSNVGIDRNRVLVVLADLAGVGEAHEAQLVAQAHAAPSPKQWSANCDTRH